MNEQTVTATSPFRSDALAGHRVLITGGGSGLGRGVARHLAEHGADVHLWGRRETALQESAENASQNAPGKVHYQTVNVRDAESIDAAMEQLWNEHGPLTAVVNNAAANFVAPTEEVSPNGYKAISSTVMDGSFYTTHAAGRRWIDQGLPGTVLSTLATWVWTGSAYTVPSAMAKAAVHSMTMSLAVEWAKYGIRLNAIAPGPFPTDFTWTVLGADNPASKLSEPDSVPAGRTGDIGELANLFLFLLSDASPYITGQTIAIDGGQMFAGPGTFASLSSLTAEDWTAQRAAAEKATAASKSERTV